MFSSPFFILVGWSQTKMAILPKLIIVLQEFCSKGSLYLVLLLFSKEGYVMGMMMHVEATQNGKSRGTTSYILSLAAATQFSATHTQNGKSRGTTSYILLLAAATQFSATHRQIGLTSPLCHCCGVYGHTNQWWPQAYLCTTYVVNSGTAAQSYQVIYNRIMVPCCDSQCA